ncbi:MAG TPA: ABC transporter substrate-binding protein [Acidimicrobiales bacterium]|nr:ABC transporter substrate-binding protein [Acidimicrobiales bacterium]
MGSHRVTERFRRGRARRSVAVLGAVLLAVSACGGDDDGDDAGDEESSGSETSADLLGPENAASGEPVRIGMVSDGATQAYDNTDELRAAQAAAEYWNAHQGGVGGRPVEVVTCETGADPAGATDCANQLVEQEVVAVTLSQSAVTESLWEPLRAAGVPTFWLQGSGAVAADEQSSFLMYNPDLTLFGLPMSVAESEDADKLAFVVIDVPQALEGLEGDVDAITEAAGLEYEVVAIPPGTADMTSQMREVADGGADVVQVIGNDAFCIAAFNGLNAVAYEGEVTTITQCITDATREGVPGEVLEGTYVTSAITLGATDDPTFQLYEAVIDEYGEDVQDVNNATSMGGYVAMSSLLTSLAEIPEDITPETVIDTIRSMPEADLPGGGGMTFQCGGSADAELPAVCTNQSLRTRLDAEGNPTEYEVVDSSDIMPE